jgi:hypothetical protein
MVTQRLMEGLTPCSQEIIWPENLKGRDYSEEVGVDGRIIME